MKHLFIMAVLALFIGGCEFRGSVKVGAGGPRTLESRGVTFLVPWETSSTQDGDFGFKFDGETAGVDNDEFDYTDYKIGVTKAWNNGVKVGGYWTDNDADGDFWSVLPEQTEGQFTVFVQKLF